MDGSGVVNKFVDIYANKSISKIVVDACQEMTTGVIGSIRDGFDALVLTEEGTLSALAIWCLTFLGVGFIWKVVPTVIRFIRGRNR